jgi:photoactive yellow protein
MERSGTESRPWPVDHPPDFDDPALLTRLETADPDAFEELPFGLITMDRSGIVTGYNTSESRFSGLRPERVVGRDLFVDVAPCINNFMVAERYWSEVSLDEQLDYVFTFRMRPAPVRLRLLAAAGSDRQYLAIRPR